MSLILWTHKPPHKKKKPIFHNTIGLELFPDFYRFSSLNCIVLLVTFIVILLPPKFPPTISILASSLEFVNIIFVLSLFNVQFVNSNSPSFNVLLNICGAFTSSVPLSTSITIF